MISYSSLTDNFDDSSEGLDSVTSMLSDIFLSDESEEIESLMDDTSTMSNISKITMIWQKPVSHSPVLTLLESYPTL